MGFLKGIFSFRTRNITAAAVLIGVSTLISRILGFLRDGLLMARFGASKSLDIYFTAFRIPDFVYGILITGGVIAVFIPLFSEIFKRNKEEAFVFTNNLLNSFLLLLIALASFLSLFAPFLIKLLAPGFSPEAQRQTVLLTRILFLSPIIFGVSAIFSGMLQYFDIFLVYSLAPILYNLGIIFGIIFLVPYFGLLGLVMGVILGALSHLLIQIPSGLKLGFKYKPYINLKSIFLKRAFRLMLPRSVGAAAYHINLIVMTAIGSVLSAGSITVFNLANNIQFFPIGVVGVSFAIASFPTFSRRWVTKEKEKFFMDITGTLRKILFLVVPLSLLFFLMRLQIVELLNFSGKFILSKSQFGIAGINLTASTLGLFSFAIFALSLSPLLTRVFFSFQDTKTPVIISISSILLNIILALLFVNFLKTPSLLYKGMVSFFNLRGIGDIRILGLPLACSISAVFQITLLYLLLEKKFYRFGFLENSFWQEKKREIFFFAKRLILATVFMAIPTWFSLLLFEKIFNPSHFWPLFLELLITSLIALSTLFFSAKILRIKEEKSLRRFVFGLIFGLKNSQKTLK